MVMMSPSLVTRLLIWLRVIRGAGCEVVDRIRAAGGIGLAVVLVGVGLAMAEGAVEGSGVHGEVAGAVTLVIAASTPTTRLQQRMRGVEGVNLNARRVDDLAGDDPLF